MRILAASLFATLTLVVIATFVAAPARGWWFPHGASTFAAEIDALFVAILVVITFFFVVTQGLLAWFVLRGARASATPAPTQHGNVPLELAWTLVPAALLAWIAFEQFPVWRSMQPRALASHVEPLAEVGASQFDWRFAYPGADGRLGTMDDLHSVYACVVPLGEPVLLELVSRDVIHSFFVPSFRVKQDIVPGTRTRLWFEATRSGDFDLACAELCGFGHYKMAGIVRVLPRAEYDAWLARLQQDFVADGREEAR